MQGLLKTEFHQILDRSLLNLLLKKARVVSDELVDGRLGEEGVLVCAYHRLCEEEVDPLRDVVLVHAVLPDGEFEQAIDKTADLGDRVLLRQVIILVQLA